jgi:peroxiredoxin
MKKFPAGFVFLCAVSLAWADDQPRLHPIPKAGENLKTGPSVGSRIPEFGAVDQNGKRQTFESLRGPNGLLLLFSRSADWCPYCKARLADLETEAAAYRAKGIGVASVTYDSQAVLQNFARRKGIHYPMLSDPDSKIIRDFGVFNDNIEPGTPAYGIAFPGNFVIDAKGIVKSKYFDADYRQSYTQASILMREFGADGALKTTVETPQLKLAYSASDAAVYPGQRVSLIVDIDLKPKMHLYAPGVQGGYIPIDWKMPESKSWLAFPVDYPASHMVTLKVINERVPVYEQHVRLVRDVTVGQETEVTPVLAADRTLTLEGTFRYQACDDKICYTPKDIPLKWTFPVGKLDLERVPVELQRKAAGK